MWASLAGTALVSAAALVPRFRAERENRAVGVMMEGQNLHDISAVGGTDFRTALAVLKREGLTGVALTEETVGDLLDRREAEVLPDAGGGRSLAANPETLARLSRGIARRSGLGSPPEPSPSGGIRFNGDEKALRSTSVGLDPDDARAVVQAGLVLIARHGNAIGAGPSYIRDVLDESHSLGATAFLASGEQVLGQRDCLEDTRYALRDLGMVYLTPEFAKIAGDANLVAKMPDATLRAHSIQQAEVDKLGPADLLERFSKAFRERNVRWLLVRPVSFGGQDPVSQTSRFLKSLRAAIVAEGGGVKAPRPLREPGAPAALTAAVSVVSVPWIFWTVGTIVSGRWRRPLAALGGLLALAGAAEPVRPLVAIEIGVLAPVLAYALQDTDFDGLPAWAAYAGISLVSLVGGLAVAGMLSTLPYMIAAKQVLGVKAILLAPVMIVAWMMLKRQTEPAALWAQPIRWGPAIVGLAVVGAVAFLLIRSGNDAPGAVSEAELKVRALLDRFLYTRPRTKEILLGHPALLIGLLLGRAGRRDWGAVALALGAIGSADIVDTMCHIHTPLDIGVARIVIGLIVGGMIGAVLWLPIKAWTGNRRVGA